MLPGGAAKDFGAANVEDVQNLVDKARYGMGTAMAAKARESDLTNEDIGALEQTMTEALDTLKSCSALPLSLLRPAGRKCKQKSLIRFRSPSKRGLTWHFYR